MFLYSLSTLAIFISGVICVTLNIDKSSESIQSDDLQFAETIIRLDDLDPHREGVSNSYSLVHTNGASSVPSRINIPLNVGNTNIANGKNRRRQLKVSDDQFPASEKPKRIKAVTKPKAASSIKKNDDIVESENLEGDSTKSGKYFSPLDDDFEEGYDQEKHYGKEGGKKYIEAHKAEEGKKGKKGYQKQEGYENAENEKRGKEENKAEISQKQGDKKAHLGEEKKFGKEYKEQGGEQGISKVKNTGRKNAKKRTGYRKTHHKDEYKNDEIFYDEEHNKEEGEELAKKQEKHAKELGQSDKESSLEEGYHEGHGAKEGKQHKGNKYEEASGHKKHGGQEKHEEEDEEYGKKAAEKKGSKFGHAEGGGSGLLFR